MLSLKVLRESLESQQLKYISLGQDESKEGIELERILARVRVAIKKRGGV